MIISKVAINKIMLEYNNNNKDLYLKVLKIMKSQDKNKFDCFDNIEIMNGKINYYGDIINDLNALLLDTGNDYIALNTKLPETILIASIGKKINRIIETDLYKDCIIKSYKYQYGNLFIVIKNEYFSTNEFEKLFQ